MEFRKFILVSLLVITLLPIYKIHAETTNAGFVSGNKKVVLTTLNEDTTSASYIEKIVNSESVKNIENIIADKTPNFISKPIIFTADILEGVRTNVGDVSLEIKEEIKKEIKSLDPDKESSKFLKPFKYAELFFFSLLSFIFNTKLVFYGLILLILFFIVRYITG
jgi:hypothetical protein